MEIEYIDGTEYTAEDRDEDNGIFSDMYKEINGFRPRDHEYFTAKLKRRSEIWETLIRYGG